MDIDVTEPIPAVDVSTPRRNVRPAVIVGSVALAVLLAAIAALVWTFSGDSKEAAQPKPIPSVPAKVPAASQPIAAEPVAAAPSMPAQPGAPAGMPGGLDPAALFGGTATDTGLTSSPAFSSASGTPTYGIGRGAPRPAWSSRPTCSGPS